MIIGYYCPRAKYSFQNRLKKRETVEVLQLAPEEVCTGDMLVLVCYHHRKLAVPLSQLTAIDENESPQQAIADWKNWVAQG